MKKKDLEFFTKVLNEEKARILDHNQKNTPDELTLSQDDLPDEVDLASSELNQSLTLRLRDRERHLLKKVESALARIEEGNFGVCEDCDEPIEVARLKARPVTTLCIRCKEEQEKEEKAYA